MSKAQSQTFEFSQALISAPWREQKLNGLLITIIILILLTILIILNQDNNNCLDPRFQNDKGRIPTLKMLLTFSPFMLESIMPITISMTCWHSINICWIDGLSQTPHIQSSTKSQEQFLFFSVRLFHFIIIHVFTGVALLVGWCMRQACGNSVPQPRWHPGPLNERTKS